MKIQNDQNSQACNAEVSYKRIREKHPVIAHTTLATRKPTTCVNTHTHTYTLSHMHRLNNRDDLSGASNNLRLVNTMSPKLGKTPALLALRLHVETCRKLLKYLIALLLPHPINI